MAGRLNFKSRRNTGKPVRAAPHIRLWRMVRRKRVSLARMGAVDALKSAQRKIDRFQKLAGVYDVPVEAVASLPAAPLMPGQDWVECRLAMGTLKTAVRNEATAARTA